MEVGGSLIAELEDAIQRGSREKRAETLRRVTDLFLSDANRLNDQQIEVFDEVLGRLARNIEEKTLAELSRRLGPVNNAPIEVLRKLARDDSITVAEPVLTQSTRLSSNDLVEIAKASPVLGDEDRRIAVLLLDPEEKVVEFVRPNRAVEHFHFVRIGVHPADAERR